jgi:hypothetical protein
MAGSVSPGGDAVGRGSLSISYVDEPTLIDAVVPASKGEVWPVLLDAFFAEGLAPDGLDPNGGLASVSRIEWSRERNGIPLRTFLDCGLSGTGRELANDARVVSAVAAQIGEEGTDVTRVTVRVDAVAFPLGEGGERARSCTTTGALERALLGRIREAVTEEATSPGVPGPATVETAPPPTYPPLAVRDLPFEPGDRLRVWLSDSERVTGAFLGFQGDSLLLRRTRRTGFPRGFVTAVQVKEIRRRPVAIGAVLGVAVGIAVATSTDLGIGGRHAVQGKILNPGLGAVAGGLVGAAVGYFFGTSWLDVPLDRIWPDSPPP